MKLKALTENLTLLKNTADPETEIEGIAYDSRSVRQGYVFVAIRGFQSDGHRFIPDAVKAGASVIICEEAPEDGVPFLQVENSRLALALISVAWYSAPACGMKLIGVTGTSGKTTTTHLIKHILEVVVGAKVGLVGTNGNRIGSELIHTEFTTPESLELQGLFRRMADEGCSYVVMEVSSHSLALERVSGNLFDVAAFTNLTQDHLDFHKTMEEYATAKRRLFSMCKAACINLDDAHASCMMEGMSCPCLTTSAFDRSADLFADQISLTADGVSFTAVYREERVPVTLAIPGLFSVHNALTALSVCMQAGIPLSEAAAALATAKGVKGRVETVPTGKDYTIIIDYSHKPDALENVLKTLRPVTRGRLITLFGCGGDRDRQKRPIMGRVAAKFSDFVIVTSDNPRTEDPDAIISEIVEGLRDTATPYHVLTDRIEAIHYAIDNAASGDVILLAGKGHEDYQIVGHEKHHMDEREIVADYLKEKSSL
ncbi:MAG: UDP-N-acetylmuramoyl-L-alanyl-D-glutamate--2,6-diaminopimelate ligase [Oscillospiraceae bacterium]|nr:UDP-N-acetylmuramoyl-L-alanyl-D-glutamate--2,6-diaminopimelate ligase [Oscillospiraceae bacterium]